MCFAVLYRETGGPYRGGGKGSPALFSESRFRVVVWGFPGCLVPGIPFAFLVLSPLWQFFFFNVPFGLARNWNRSRLEDDRVGTVFFLFLLGDEHIYRYCKFFCFIVSMPSAQLSLSSQDSFFSLLWHHDIYQLKYHLSSSSSSCLSPRLSQLINTPTQRCLYCRFHLCCSSLFGIFLPILVARIGWVVTRQEK